MKDEKSRQLKKDIVKAVIQDEIRFIDYVVEDLIIHKVFLIIVSVDNLTDWMAQLLIANIQKEFEEERERNRCCIEKLVANVTQRFPSGPSMTYRLFNVVGVNLFTAFNDYLTQLLNNSLFMRGSYEINAIARYSSRGRYTEA